MGSAAKQTAVAVATPVMNLVLILIFILKANTAFLPSSFSFVVIY